MAVGSSVLQIVGYKNSGKTTLIEKLVSILREKGICVGVLKHHGHGGVPHFDQNKDGIRLFHSGALVTLVEGEGTVQLVGALHENGIENKIALLHQFNVEVVIVEGYKNLSYPKIAMIRRKEELYLLEKLSNLIAVVYWPESRDEVLDYILEIPKYAIESEFLFDLIDIEKVARR